MQELSGETGITLAYAGKSRVAALRLTLHRDHPRVCGEKPAVAVLFSKTMGSPPRMRGKVQLGEIDLQDIWITPAYAGKSGPCPDRVPPAGDHPRVCGEKSQSTSASPRALGSPPRMRGKGVKQSNSRIRMGITPAYAGKSCIYRSTTSISWDHPRVCGEKQKTPPWGVEKGGSPPRMRGKGVQPRDKRVAVRITPAYAGKSCHQEPLHRLSWDHPRVCGEKTQEQWDMAVQKGSPPRMRGKGSPDYAFAKICGITPAYAGKSPLCQRSERF